MEVPIGSRKENERFKGTRNMRDKCAMHKTNTAWGNLKSQWLNAFAQTKNAPREHKTCGTSARCILDDFSNRGKRKHGQIHKSIAVDAAQVINERVESDGGNCGADGILLKRHVSGLSKRTRARTTKVWWVKSLLSAVLMSTVSEATPMVTAAGGVASSRGRSSQFD